jgi:hypothetical protein
MGYYGVVAVIAGAGEGIVREILLLSDRAAGRCWHRNQLRAGFAVGLGSFFFL